MLSGDEIYDDYVTSGPLAGASGSGQPPYRTAVGAADPEPAFDAIFTVLDGFDGPRLREFTRRLQLRYRLSRHDFEDTSR